MRSQSLAAEHALAELRVRRGADVTDRWQRYRDAYEQLLHDDAEAHDEPAENRHEAQIWNPAKPSSTGAVAPSFPDADRHDHALSAAEREDA